MNDNVCIRIVGGHSFLCHRTPIFQLYIFFYSIRISIVPFSDLFVKILFHITGHIGLGICLPNFMKIDVR